jgi:hypothetical protein
VLTFDDVRAFGAIRALRAVTRRSEIELSHVFACWNLTLRLVIVEAPETARSSGRH